MRYFEIDHSLENARFQLQETVMDDFILAFCANQTIEGPQQTSGNHIYNLYRSNERLTSYRLGVEIDPEQSDISPKSIMVRKRIYREATFEQADYFLKFPGSCVLYRCGVFDHELLDSTDEHAERVIGRSIKWDTEAVGAIELEAINQELTEHSWPYINL